MADSGIPSFVIVAALILGAALGGIALAALAESLWVERWLRKRHPPRFLTPPPPTLPSAPRTSVATAELHRILAEVARIQAREKGRYRLPRSARDRVTIRITR